MLRDYWTRFRVLPWHWQVVGAVLVLLLVHSCSANVGGPTLPLVPVPDLR